MNYKKVLTEEAVEQFRKEGATIVVITLYSEDTDKAIRDMEVDLAEDDKSFAIAGRTPTAEAAMTKHFCGNIVGEDKWFPFPLFRKSKDVDKALAEVAAIAGLNPTDLKWSYINVR